MNFFLKNTFRTLYQSLSLLLNEKTLLAGVLLRINLYFLLVILFQLSPIYIFISFLLEFTQLFLISLLAPSKKNQICKLIWLNPLFFICSIYSPLFLLGPILLLILYIVVLKLNYFYIVCLSLISYLISFEVFLITTIASYLLILGYLKSIKIRLLTIFFMLICWESAYYLLGIDLPIFQVFYRLIFLGLVVTSKTQRHIEFQKFNLILYLFSVILLFLNLDSSSLVPLILIFYIFSYKESLDKLDTNYALVTIILCINMLLINTDILTTVHSNITILPVTLALMMLALRQDHFRSFSYSPYKVFLISGDSGVGKDRFVDEMMPFIGANYTNHISGDDFHKYERSSNIWNVVTHLNPLANSVDIMQKKIERLLKGRAIFHRHYDHNSGKFSSQFKIKPRFNLIVSGLHSQYVEKINAYRIHLSMDSQLNKLFKVKRDVYERGKTINESLNQYQTRRHDAEKYIELQKNICDVHFKLSTPHGERLNLFFDKLKKPNSVDIQAYNKLIDEITNSMFWKISSSDFGFLEHVFNILVHHSFDNVSKVSYSDINTIEISVNCEIPNLDQIRKRQLINGPFNYYANLFDSFAFAKEDLNLPTFITLQLILHKNSMGENKS